MPAAVDQWFDADFGTATNIQYANAFGSVCLVAGERHQVDAQAFYIEIHAAYTLSGIDMQGRTAGMGYFGQLRQRIDATQLVVHRHQRYQSGIGPHGLAQLIGCDAAIGAGCQPGNLETFVLEGGGGIHHRFVLNG